MWFSLNSLCWVSRSILINVPPCFDFDWGPNIKQTICQTAVYLLSIFYRPPSYVPVCCTSTALWTVLYCIVLYSVFLWTETVFNIHLKCKTSLTLPSYRDIKYAGPDTQTSPCRSFDRWVQPDINMLLPCANQDISHPHIISKEIRDWRAVLSVQEGARRPASGVWVVS